MQKDDHKLLHPVLADGRRGFRMSLDKDSVCRRATCGIRPSADLFFSIVPTANAEGCRCPPSACSETSANEEGPALWPIERLLS